MEENHFKAHPIARTAVITIPAPLAEAFALFGPVKEQDWAAGWKPEIIYSTTSLVEEHMVFRTPAAHGQAAGEYTWVISKYLPEQAFIEYTVFADERLWWITIQCREEDRPDQRQVAKSQPETRAEITYTYVGLTEHGQAVNERALHRMYAHDLKDWEHAIRHFLKTGESVKT